MADWTPPPWAQLVAGKAWTDEKAAAAFENVIALAEAATGAPRLVPAALQAPGVITGALNGTTFVAFTGLGALSQIRADVSHHGGGGAFRVSFSADGGSTWGSEQNLFTPAANEGLIGNLVINLVTGAAAWVGYGIRLQGNQNDTSSGQNGAATLTVPANCNAVRFRLSGSSVGRVILTPMGGRE